MESKKVLETANLKLTLAEPDDTIKARQFAEYARGLVKAKSFVVNHGSVLTAGFAPHLAVLQKLCISGDFAFSDIIAPSSNVDASPTIAAPKFTGQGGFRYVLDSLRQDASKKTEDDDDDDAPLQTTGPSITFHPKDARSPDVVEEVKRSTTLDEGQSTAIVENLSRGLAFTQGPPGTGKTFLVVAECEAILKSKEGKEDCKPIVVVCQTNHALDDFIVDLHKRSVSKIVRLGQNYRDPFIRQFEIGSIRSKNRGCGDAHKSFKACDAVDRLAQDGLNWAQAISTNEVGYCVVENYLREKHPSIYTLFLHLEAINADQADGKATAYKWSGFAYHFWLDGGDIDDEGNLLKKLDEASGGASAVGGTVEGSEYKTNMFKDAAAAFKESVAIPGSEIWQLDAKSRLDLVASWVADIEPQVVCEQFAEVHRRHREAIKHKFEVFDSADKTIILNHKTQVLAITSTGCARSYNMLKELGPKVLIFEEAPELLEAHSIVALVPSIELCISIGDPQQLRPHLTEQALTCAKSPQYALDKSLFERLMGRLPCSQLNVQRRAHPEIADILRAGDYPYLKDAPSTLDLPMPPGMSKRLHFWDHQHSESRPDSKSAFVNSWCNKFEVEAIFYLVKYLIERLGVTMNMITILTPYNGQLKALVRRLSQQCRIELTPEDRKTLVAAHIIDDDKPREDIDNVSIGDMIKVATVDNYQGEQNDIIIFSPVRSNANGSGGFLREANRRNVAVSRARCGFFIVGDSQVMKKREHLANVVEVFEKKNAIGPYLPVVVCTKHAGREHRVSKPSQFDKIPECHEKCVEMLPGCGHMCQYPCHPPEMHEDGRRRCTEPCEKTRERGHGCEKTCSEPCGPCAVPLTTVTLKCGHDFVPFCSTKMASVHCTAVMEEKKLSCGHAKAIQCCDPRPELCRDTCGAKLACGHKCSKQCIQCTVKGEHAACTTPCGKAYSNCTHPCKSNCHEGKCPPCTGECPKACVHGRCGLPCHVVCDPCVKGIKHDGCVHQDGDTTLCSLPSTLLPCSKPCTNLLSCGIHTCSSICGERCLHDCMECEGKTPEGLVMVLPCSHAFPVQETDALFGMDEFYDVEPNGTIGALNVRSLPSAARMVCPTCNDSIEKSKRYSFVARAEAVHQTVERLYAKLGRKMAQCARRVRMAEETMAREAEDFVRSLKSGPMSTRPNRAAFDKHCLPLRSAQDALVEFAKGVVRPVETAIRRLAKTIDNPSILTVSPLIFTSRFARLYCRCRRVLLEFSARVHVLLRDSDDSHNDAFVKELRKLVLHRTQGEIHYAAVQATAAREAGSARLEAEFLVNQLAFTTLLRFANPEILPEEADISQRAKDACFSIGNVYDVFAEWRDVSARYEERVKVETPTATLGGAEFWAGWTQHFPGTLRHCARRHPFSATGHRGGCPECAGAPAVMAAGTAPVSRLASSADFAAAFRKLSMK